MFNFFKRKADVLNHWIAFADGFQTSPFEFYSALARELESRKVPQMQVSDVELAEGGLLSEKRVYLRMLRERLVFDVCAAPFGSGFFFSCRTAEIPLTVSLWQIVALAIGFSLSAGLSLYIAVSVFGFFYGVFVWFIGWIAFLVSSIYLMRNAVARGRCRSRDGNRVILPD